MRLKAMGFKAWRRAAREAGSVSVEYALLIVVAAAMAGVLLKVVNSPAVLKALTGIVTRALG